MNYDAVVAGAGTAGCVFAGRLARAGFRVLVVEPSAPDRLGHDWWDTVERSIFTDIGIDRPAPPEARQPFAFRMNVSGRTFPVDTGMPPDLVNIERRMFAARLIEWAAAGGVEFRFVTAASAPLFQDGKCVGITVHECSVPGVPPVADQIIGAPLTVDASGIAGALRRHVPPELLAAAGMQAEIDDGAMLHTWREVFMDASDGGESVICMDESDSIAWISRESDGLVDVFAGALGNAIDPAETAGAMLAREGGIGESVRPGRRWKIPLRRPFDGLVLPGFMLIGDSACMADASNGSGITNTVHAAIMAADAAIEALRAGDTGMARLWAYPARFFPSHAGLAFLGSLKKFIFTAPRAPVLSFMAAGGIRGPAFWTMRREFGIRGLLSKVGVFMRTRGGPALLPPLCATLHEAFRAEGLFKAYPRSWNPEVFSEWRRKLPPP